MNVWVLLQVCEADDTQSIQVFHEQPVADASFDELIAELRESYNEEPVELNSFATNLEFRSCRFEEEEIVVTLSLETVK